MCNKWLMCMFLIMNIISNVNLDHIVACLVSNWFAPWAQLKVMFCPIEGDVLSNLRCLRLVLE